MRSAAAPSHISPSNMDESGSCDMKAQPMSRAWGVECPKSLRGGEPLSDWGLRAAHYQPLLVLLPGSWRSSP